MDHLESDKNLETLQDVDAKDTKATHRKPYEMPVVKSLKLDDNLRLVVYGGKNDENWYDIRYYTENDNKPTRRGVRLRRSWISKIINVFEELDEYEVREMVKEFYDKDKK